MKALFIRRSLPFTHYVYSILNSSIIFSQLDGSVSGKPHCRGVREGHRGFRLAPTRNPSYHIHYQSIEDLKKFNRKIAYHTGKWGVMSTIFGSNSDTLHDKVRKKVDGIFEKAQHLLGMRKRMHKVHIYICRNKKQLDDNYHRIYSKPCRFRAWYVYELNAVYVNHQDLDEGMLSHELAHSIIDHYLLVRPPRASAEILASYVDLHLFD